MLRLALVLSLFCTTLLSAQADDERRNARRNTVIAPSGLNLRDAPGIDGAMIGRVPYGTKLELADRKFHNPDRRNTFPSLAPHAWAHVRYKGQTGYLYDAYLGLDYSVDGYREEPAGVNQDFIIVQRQSYQQRTIADFKAYQWYGIYRVGTDDALVVRQVKPEMRYGSEETRGGLFLTLGRKYDDPLFFLGSRTALPTGLIDGFIADPFGQPLRAEGPTNNRRLIDLGVLIAPIPDYEMHTPETTLTLTTDGQKAAYELPIQGSARGLLLAADLNGDGVRDYLIHGEMCGQDTVFENVLYLSGPGKTLRAVALWTDF